MKRWKWEYKVIDLAENSEEDETELNDLGEKGWELVSVSTSSGGEAGFLSDGNSWSASTAYLKRRKKESHSRSTSIISADSLESEEGEDEEGEDEEPDDE